MDKDRPTEPPTFHQAFRVKWAGPASQGHGGLCRAGPPHATWPLAQGQVPLWPWTELAHLGCRRDPTLLPGLSAEAELAGGNRDSPGTPELAAHEQCARGPVTVGCGLTGVACVFSSFR